MYPPETSRARRRRLRSMQHRWEKPVAWWRQVDPPWWARLGLGLILYGAFLLKTANSFDADEYLKLLAFLLIGGATNKK